MLWCHEIINCLFLKSGDMKRKNQSPRRLQEEAEIKQLIESLQRDIIVSI